MSATHDPSPATAHHLPVDLAGRHVVVTGGTGALGTAVVRAFTAAGATCHVPCLEGHAPRDPVVGAVYTLDVDLASEAAVAAFYDRVPALWASLHLAGGFAWSRLEDTTLELVRQQRSINADTCFLCCREAARVLRAGGVGGRIVNVASRAVAHPAAGMAASAMSKAAVVALTATLAEELRGDGILVNAIVPSIIDTPANRAAMPDADRRAWSTPAAIAAVLGVLASPSLTTTSGALVPV